MIKTSSKTGQAWFLLLQWVEKTNGKKLIEQLLHQFPHTGHDQCLILLLLLSKNSLKNPEIF